MKKSPGRVLKMGLIQVKSGLGSVIIPRIVFPPCSAVDGEGGGGVERVDRNVTANGISVVLELGRNIWKWVLLF